MISHIRDKTLFLELCPTLSVTQPMGMILGVVLSGHVVEMNDSPKSDALSEKSKEKIVTIDCL